MVRTHCLGFPRIGAQRELKFALERFWRADINLAELEEVSRTLRAKHWAVQQSAGLELVTVGDFALYDHMLNHIQLFGCEPSRFGFNEQTSAIERYFAMARGVRDATGQVATGAALEMTKWFDTNYHYLVPEFDATTRFKLNPEPLLAEIAEAHSLGYRSKVVLIGPLSFLWLGKLKTSHFDRLQLLDELLVQYEALFKRLADARVEWVQLDEPILGLDLPEHWRNAFEPSYLTLTRARCKLMVATYFSTLEENLLLACKLPVAGLHIDAVRGGDELDRIVDWLPSHRELSVGIVDGRNIWRTDLDRALRIASAVHDKRPNGIWLAPSCSLLHVPVTLDNETSLDPELKTWLSFACEKLAELNILKRAINEGHEAVARTIEAARKACESRRNSARVHDDLVAHRVSRLSAADASRASAFSVRQVAQRKRLNLPFLPTTTIGSFPQTGEIRNARAQFRRGEIGEQTYRDAMRKEIAHVVAQQEKLDLDVLVHGEAERNDMVEYFGEQLSGFAFTSHGWVQSYGSRCVKPPVIYGDVSLSAPMTVEWTTYAQSLTSKPMKGMLTGPVTMLQWSFVRDDQPRATTAMQIALAIRDEVESLQYAGVAIIQIDEPAFREGLPIRKREWAQYLAWAALAFRVSASVARDDTQIHTHMCYSEFNDILPEIAAMDADVITIETSRSNMELLDGFGEYKYPNEIGPGVYDIHSPRIPTVEEMERLLKRAVKVIPARNLWVNPDCGLKTRQWPETLAALQNMITATRAVRASLTSVADDETGSLETSFA